MEKRKKTKLGQVSTEYLMVVGFVTFVVIVTLGIALFYSGTVKDRIKATQVSNFANKIIATAESVYYAGEPSKATITAYLPENVNDISINQEEQSLVIEFSTGSGANIRAFTSNVPIIEGTPGLSASQGLKRIVVKAGPTEITISQA